MYNQTAIVDQRLEIKYRKVIILVESGFWIYQIMNQTIKIIWFNYRALETGVIYGLHYLQKHT